jgi:hypothetical protein
MAYGYNKVGSLGLHLGWLGTLLLTQTLCMIHTAAPLLVQRMTKFLSPNVQLLSVPCCFTSIHAISCRVLSSRVARSPMSADTLLNHHLACRFNSLPTSMQMVLASRSCMTPLLFTGMAHASLYSCWPTAGTPDMCCFVGKSHDLLPPATA